jgi:hypothetical protein
MKKLLLLLVAIGSLTTGCKKNQPFISFTNQNYRIIGSWNLDEVFSEDNVNGGRGSSGSFYKPTVLTLNQDHSATLVGNLFRANLSDTLYKHNISGSWDISGDQVTLNWDGNTVYNPEHQKYTVSFNSTKVLDLSYKTVNSGGGITADFTFTYHFIK